MEWFIKKAIFVVEKIQRKRFIVEIDERISSSVRGHPLPKPCSCNNSSTLEHIVVFPPFTRRRTVLPSGEYAVRTFSLGHEFPAPVVTTFGMNGQLKLCHQVYNIFFVDRSFLSDNPVSLWDSSCRDTLLLGVDHPCQNGVQ
ncbi:hypothetical protein TNCV_2918521 [Trichonephila clavipes]|nr:hypothetical protein TNCV_2918521 [Trichonephila clavipes]